MAPLTKYTAGELSELRRAFPAFDRYLDREQAQTLAEALGLVWCVVGEHDWADLLVSLDAAIASGFVDVDRLGKSGFTLFYGIEPVGDGPRKGRRKALLMDRPVLAPFHYVGIDSGPSLILPGTTATVTNQLMAALVPRYLLIVSSVRARLIDIRLGVEPSRGLTFPISFELWREGCPLFDFPGSSLYGTNFGVTVQNDDVKPIRITMLLVSQSVESWVARPSHMNDEPRYDQGRPSWWPVDQPFPRSSPFDPIPLPESRHDNSHVFKVERTVYCQTCGGSGERSSSIGYELCWCEAGIRRRAYRDNF